jgi:UPF0755 protein
MKKRYIPYIFLLLLILGALFIGLQQEFLVKTTQDHIYIAKPGDSLKKIAQGMQAQNIIPHAQIFILLARFKGDAQMLQAGEYVFEKNSTLSMMLDKMVKGDVLMHSIRIGEGWTFAQVAAQILAVDALSKTLDWTAIDTILQQLKLSDHKPEGLFYPETYHFPRGFTDAALLTLAYQDMQKYLNTNWQTRAQDLPYENPYQALIAASIIEKETAIASELNKVAGVIVRRLQQSMLLQVDPSVVYGLGAHYEKSLTKADLKYDTPYNTYLHLGLPPTPIAIPSPGAIHAALHPEPGEALYFVARGDGSHVFSDSLAAHNQAVQEYRNQIGNQ